MIEEVFKLNANKCVHKECLESLTVLVFESLMGVLVGDLFQKISWEHSLARVEVMSELIVSVHVLLHLFLIICDQMSLLGKSGISYSSVGRVGDTSFVYHVSEHGCDLLLRLLGSESLDELLLLFHVSHFLDCLVIHCSFMTFPCLAEFLLEMFNHLSELKGTSHLHCVGLVLSGVKQSHVVIAGLVFGC